MYRAILILYLCCLHSIIFAQTTQKHSLNRVVKDSVTIDSALNMQNVEMKINEVVVRTKTHSVKYDVDKIIIDPKGFPDALVAVDLLQTVPSLNVSIEGKVKYRGDGSLKVYINGNPTTNGDTKLKQIPAERISRIELITNPSAKYDAEGSAGIINIILKRNRLSGYAINSSLQYSTHGSYEWLFSIDKKGERGGWYVEGALANYIWSDYKTTIDRVVIDGANTINSKSTLNNKGSGKTNNIDLGFNYYLSKKDYIDISIGVQPWKNINLNKKTGDIAELINNDNSSENAYRLNSSNELIFQYLGGKLNYKHIFNDSTDHSLSFYLNYDTYLQPAKERQIDIKEYLDNTLAVGYEGTENNQIILNSKLEYRLPIKKNFVLESGLEINSDKIPQITSVSGTFDNQENITPFSNIPSFQRVEYTQNIYSAYLIAKYKLHKFNFQLGLRYEISSRNADYNWRYNSLENNNDYNNSSCNLFPSAHITYNISETHQFHVSYSSRIDRAKYYEFLPLIQYYDIYTFNVGNADLLPSYTNAYELGYTKSWNNNFISANIFARQSSQVIEDYSEILTQNIMLVAPQNIGTSLSSGIELMGGVDIFKWWNINIASSIYLYKLNIDMEGDKRKESQITGDIKINNKFTLPKSFNIRWSLLYNSPLILAQGKKTGYINSNISIAKGFKNNTWIVTAIWANMFNSNRHTTTNIGYNYNISSRAINKSYLSLKIAFRFNNQK